MDVVVAGGTGFIGTELCRTLDKQGHDVRALSRSPDDAALHESVETVIGDVTAYDSIVDPVDGADAVVNLVALSPLFDPSGGRTHERVHFTGTENLVAACEEGDVDYFLQMSALGADPSGDTAYLRAKGRAEDAVRSSDLDWTIVRPSVVFGEGGEFVPFTKKLTTPYVTGLPGGGKTRFQPIYRGDLVPMLVAAVSEDAHVGETYEIGGPEVLTLREVTELAYEADGKSVTVLPIPMALASIGLSLADPLPFVPFGSDQARSLRVDNTVQNNDVTTFGVTPAELTTLRSYLRLE
ncbi:complex I NDUFA9 subunit family protein [Halobacteriales archaeon SW_7_68_16]|nr:MAG: complex I NDUFA9 subunit family protein [Halobacteriales archaeon SW_7_68_16]